DHARRVHLALDRRLGGGDHELVERDPEQVAAPLRHADDPVRDPVNPDRLADGVLRLEQPLGEIVPHDQDGAARPRFLRRERAPLLDLDVADLAVALGGGLQGDVLRGPEAVRHGPAPLGPPRREPRHLREPGHAVFLRLVVSAACFIARTRAPSFRSRIAWYGPATIVSPSFRPSSTSKYSSPAMPTFTGRNVATPFSTTNTPS